MQIVVGKNVRVGCRRPAWGLAVASLVALGLGSLPTLAIAQETISPRAVTPDLVTGRVESVIENGIEYLLRARSPGGSWPSRGRYGSYPTANTA